MDSEVKSALQHVVFIIFPVVKTKKDNKTLDFFHSMEPVG